MVTTMATRTITIPTIGPLTRIEQRAADVQRQAAPLGHVVVGPLPDPPFWRCLTCHERWSSGVHPEPRQLPLPRRRDDDDVEPWWMDI
jgi:hypothetical protein